MMPVPMRWMRWSLFSQISLLAYLELIECVNLFPWNDVRRGNGQGSVDIAIGAVMIGAIVATIRRWRIAMAIATVLYAIWLWLQIDTWWIGYIRGASPAWKRTYARFFSETVQVLPRGGDHLPPDACHLVLQLLILAALATTALATAAAIKKRRALPPGASTSESMENYSASKVSTSGGVSVSERPPA
jgi:hypothetical protein